MFAAVSNITLLDALEAAKWACAGAYVIATIGVTLGVYWEGAQFSKARQEFGNKVLIVSLAADTLFTIFVFGIDGWIGQIQRSEIITLENRVAARSLSDAQFADIAKRLAPLKGQQFHIVTYWKNPEALDISNRIYAALVKAGWLYDKPASSEFILGVDTGVTMLYDKRVPGNEKAASALVEALNANGIAAADDGQNPPTTEAINPKLTINVGIKP